MSFSSEALKVETGFEPVRTPRSQAWPAAQKPRLTLVKKVEVDRSRDALLTEFGVKTLEDGKCPTDAGRGADQTKDGKAVDDRLHQKLQHNQQKRQQQQKKKQQQKKNKQQTKEQKQRSEQKKKEQQKKQQEKRKKQQQQQKQREKKLREQNQRGLKDRKDKQQQEQGFGYEPSW